MFISKKAYKLDKTEHIDHPNPVVGIVCANYE